MYKESESQKESVIAKLGVLEEERKKLIEEVTTNERQLKETSRVSYIQMNRGMGGMVYLVPPCSYAHTTPLSQCILVYYSYSYLNLFGCRKMNN